MLRPGGKIRLELTFTVQYLILKKREEAAREPVFPKGLESLSKGLLSISSPEIN